MELEAFSPLRLEGKTLGWSRTSPQVDLALAWVTFLVSLGWLPRCWPLVGMNASITWISSGYPGGGGRQRGEFHGGMFDGWAEEGDSGESVQGR